MCGYICFINSPEYVEKIKNLLLNNSLSHHRGPDSKKIYSNKSFFGIFRRLAIIDLNRRSNQPFTSDDGRYVIFFNGEIYNYKEIKLNLINKNIKFRTTGDTEVLLKAYLYLGANFIDKIKGMYSFCIWDNKKKKLVAYRDRFGQKPLYYFKTPTGLILASEIKDIQRLKNFTENPHVIFKYLYRNILDIEKDTFYKNIFRLPPSSKLTFENEKLKIEKYYKITISEKSKFSETIFRENFDKTVKSHLISDVNMAFLLSGGLDSSSNVMTSLKYLKNLKAFSIIPKHTVNEKGYIKSLLDKSLFSHEYVDVEKKINSLSFREVLSFQDEPFHGSNCIYQFYLHKYIANKKYKVLITGEGGDEILGGYNRMFLYYLTQLYHEKKYSKIDEMIKLRKINKKITINKIKKLFFNYNNNISDFEDNTSFDFTNDKQIEKKYLNLNWNNLKKIDKNFFKNSLINSIFTNDLQMALRMTDRNCMASSIENRTPFLDHEFVDYVFSHQIDDFYKNSLSKSMIRLSMKDILTKKIISRRDKSGRPGSDVYFIFYKIFDEFIDLLENSSLYQYGFETKKIKFDLLKINKQIKLNFNDENKIFRNKINFFFRVFSYLVWKDLNK